MAIDEESEAVGPLIGEQRCVVVAAAATAGVCEVCVHVCVFLHGEEGVQFLLLCSEPSTFLARASLGN